MVCMQNWVIFTIFNRTKNLELKSFKHFKPQLPIHPPGHFMPDTEKVCLLLHQTSEFSLISVKHQTQNQQFQDMESIDVTFFQQNR